jgi:hypothetical protein
MVERNFDLFGQPVRPGLGLKGRPRHMPSDDLRRKVRYLHEFGFSHDEIAKEIGITAPTLRLNYFHELESSSLASRKRQARDARRHNDRKGASHG